MKHYAWYALLLAASVVQATEQTPTAEENASAVEKVEDSAQPQVSAPQVGGEDTSNQTQENEQSLEAAVGAEDSAGEAPVAEEENDKKATGKKKSKSKGKRKGKKGANHKKVSHKHKGKNKKHHGKISVNPTRPELVNVLQNRGRVSQGPVYAPQSTMMAPEQSSQEVPQGGEGAASCATGTCPAV